MATSDARSLLCLTVSERILAGLAAERLNQHAIEPEFARLAELFDTDGHRFVSGCWLRPVGAEQAIPPRQVEAELLLVSRVRIEWWTRCMSGVTTSQRNTRSIPAGCGHCRG